MTRGAWLESLHLLQRVVEIDRTEHLPRSVTWTVRWAEHLLRRHEVAR